MATMILVPLLFWMWDSSVQASSEYCNTDACSANSINIKFIRMPLTWFEAEKFCKSQGGALLGNLNNKTMLALKQKALKKQAPNCATWVGQDLSNSTGPHDYNDSFLCTYIIIQPAIQLVTSSNCNMTYGSICVLGENTEASKKRTRKNVNHGKIRRRKHASTDVPQILNSMASNMQDTHFFVQTAVDFVDMMEVGAIEPTVSEMITYLQLLQNVTSTLSSNDTDNAGLILGCAGAITILSTSSCATDILSETEQSAMSILVIEILEELSVKMTSSVNGVTTIIHPLATINISSESPQQLADSVIGDVVQGPYYILPSMAALESQLKQYVKVNVQVFSFRMNLLPNIPNENITGAVSSLTFRNTEGEINLYNLSQSIQVFLPRPDAPEVFHQSETLQEHTFITVTFNVTDTNSTVILTAKPNVNTSLQLQLARGSPSQNAMFLYNTVLNQTSGYRWLITPDMLQLGEGPWYVQVSLLSPSKNDGVTVMVSLFPIKCLFWNKTLEAWSTSGCLVGMKTEPHMTQCLCNHLTTFGSSFFVMPNQVDLSRTAAYFATVKDNYVVPALLGTFFSVYLLALIWACRADKWAIRKSEVTLVRDTQPCAQCFYLLSIYTGHRRGANTSAQVEMTLLGSEGESRPCLLTDSKKPLFERGGVDTFLITTPFPLGELQSIRLSHDNSGGHPSWYLCKVTVQDMQTKRYWHFLCSSWLSSVKGDGLMKRTFHVASNNEITSFGNIFQSRTSTGFRDQHIWISVVNPPQSSPFTRAQRISCCMCLLLCTMAINIMFFNMPQSSESPVLISFGSLEITLQQIMIGIESGLLMFPINIFIVTIFRSTKPRPRKHNNKDRDKCEQKAAVSVATLLKDMEQLINSLSKNKRNNVSALEKPLNSYADLCEALNVLHEVLQLMQGENNGDAHWAYCSQFVLCSLHRLAKALGRLDGKSFPSEEDYWGVQNTVNLLLKKAGMVSSSHMLNGPRCSLPAPKPEEKKGCSLPWWFVFVGWFLLVSISGISTFFTLLYGFVYGKETSTKWVISLGLSLFQSIFVLQPLKVLGLAIFFALTLKPVLVEENEEVDLLLAEQRQKCTHMSGKAAP